LARVLASGRHLGPPLSGVKDGAGTSAGRRRRAARMGLFRRLFRDLFRLGNTGKPCAKHLSRAFELGRAMIELLQFISYLLTIYVYIVIAMAILSWLIAFNVVNTRNPVVHMIAELLYRLTEPVLRPIRNLLPNMGGIDISPIILFLIILFIQSVILPNIAKLFI
jgi:YggT family protein